MMHKSLGGFRAALWIGWLALSVAGALYARSKGIPGGAALPIVAAFLLEYSFYLVPGFAAVRERLPLLFPGMRFPFALAASGLPPYLVYSLGTGQFHWDALVRLAALALAVSLWYVVLPRAPAADLALLTLLAAVILRKFFEPIYPSPIASVRGLDILGHLMLIRLTVLVMLVERQVTGTGFGFLPSSREWAVGLRYFLYFVPIGFPLALWTRLIHLDLAGFTWWKLLGTFAGILWVVALSEEFFFRGLLQQWIAGWTHHPQIAILIASAIFGLVHLSFRVFPNWKHALIAGLLGWFCGRAYQAAGSIRASMVTHAFVVTAWRVVFS